MRCIGFAAIKNRARCAIALTILALVSSGGAAESLAFNGPDGFGGVRWGATEEQLNEKFDFLNCFNYAPGYEYLGERSCSGRAWMLGDLYLEPSYSFRRDQLVSVGFSFKSSEFERVTGVFVELYGLPTTDSIEPFKSPKGIESTNRTLKWLGPVIAIRLTRYNRDIPRGFAIIQTRAELEESEEIWRRIYGRQ